MEPLEQVTVLMTLMKRLGQVMDHERAVLGSMRLDALPDLQEEKTALAEAYEIELARLRRSPETLGTLEPGVRVQLQEAMRGFQETVTANLNALAGARSVVDKVLGNIADSLARGVAGPGAAGRARIEREGGAEVIALSFDRKA